MAGLNRVLVGAADAHALLGAISGPGTLGRCTLVNCATALHRLAKFRAQGATWDAADAARASAVCVRAASLLHAEAVSARSLTSLAWAASRLEAHAELLDALAAAAARSASRGDLDPCALANVAVTLSGDSKRHRAALNVVVGASKACVGDFSPQELTNLLWALAPSREPAEQALFRAAAPHAERQAAAFSADGLSRVCVAFAQCDVREPGMLAAFGTRAVAMLRAGEPRPERGGAALDGVQLAGLCWALASLGVGPTDVPGLAEAVQAAVSSAKPELDGSSAARLLWAVSRWLPDGGDEPSPLLSTARALGSAVCAPDLAERGTAPVTTDAPATAAGTAIAADVFGAVARVRDAELARTLAPWLCAPRALSAIGRMGSQRLGVACAALCKPWVRDALARAQVSALRAALLSRLSEVCAHASPKSAAHIQLALQLTQPAPGEGGAAEPAAHAANGPPASLATGSWCAPATGSWCAPATGGWCAPATGGWCAPATGGWCAPATGGWCAPATGGWCAPAAETAQLAALARRTARAATAESARAARVNRTPAEALAALSPWQGVLAPGSAVLLIDDSTRRRAHESTRRRAHDSHDALSSSGLASASDGSGAARPGADALCLHGTLSAAGLSVRRWNRFVADGAAAESASAWPAPELRAASPPLSACVLRWPWYASGDAARLLLHAAASVLPPGAAVWVAGRVDEGAMACAAALESTGMFGTARALSRPGDEVAIFHAVVSHRAPPRSEALARLSQSHSHWAQWHQESAAHAAAPGPPRGWCTYPGLFNAGVADSMTTALLRVLPPPPPHGPFLDFACGTGAIASALRARAPRARVDLLDADALALDAACANVPGATKAYLSDGWPARAMRARRYAWIVSNPPVHRGRPSDLSVLRELIRGAPRRLRRGGTLWIVAQEQTPVGLLLARARPRFERVAATQVDHGRFVVWRATTRASRSLAA